MQKPGAISNRLKSKIIKNGNSIRGRLGDRGGGGGIKVSAVAKEALSRQQRTESRKDHEDSFSTAEASNIKVTISQTTKLTSNLSLLIRKRRSTLAQLLKAGNGQIGSSGSEYSSSLVKIGKHSQEFLAVYRAEAQDSSTGAASRARPNDTNINAAVAAESHDRSSPIINNMGSSGAVFQQHQQVAEVVYQDDQQAQHHHLLQQQPTSVFLQPVGGVQYVIQQQQQHQPLSQPRYQRPVMIATGSSASVMPQPYFSNPQIMIGGRGSSVRGRGPITLQVRGLHPEVQEKDMLNLFEGYGEVEKIVMKTNNMSEITGAAVTYKKRVDGLAVIQQLDGQLADGYYLSIKEDTATKLRTSSSGGYTSAVTSLYMDMKS